MDTNNSEKQFVKNMVRLRKDHLLTQDDLSLRLGIKRSRLGAWEELRAFPSVHYMLIVCNVFKVGLVEMLTTDVKTNVEPEYLISKKRKLNYSIY